MIGPVRSYILLPIYRIKWNKVQADVCYCDEKGDLAFEGHFSALSASGYERLDLILEDKLCESKQS